MAVLSFYSCKFFDCILNVRVGHEQVPYKAASVILHHDCDRALVESHKDRSHPVDARIVGIVKAEFAPKPGTAVAIEVLERAHRLFWSVREGGESSGRSDLALVDVGCRFAGAVAPDSVAGGKAPGIFTVALVTFGILNAVAVVDGRDCLVVLEVIAVAVGQGARVEAEEGVVAEEQWTSGRFADLEFLSVLTAQER